MTRINAISAHEIDRLSVVCAFRRNLVMLDVVFIGIAVIFFAACLAYTLACERL